MGTGSFPGVK